MPDINAILALPCNSGSSRRGAQLGRSSQTQGQPERLHLQRMRFVDGDYDTGGAYWGNTRGTAIYCAFSPETSENDPPVRVFVRANNRDDAKKQVLDLLDEGWTFYK